MTIADGVLDDLIFPTDIIARAVRGRRERRTEIATTQAGVEQRRAVTARTRRLYEIGHVARKVPEFERILAVHETAEGRRWGFLLADPTDSIVAGTEGVMRPLSASGTPVGAVGFGYGVPTYRLAKRYTVQSYSRDVDVFKPQTGTVALFRAASSVTIGVSAGNAALDVTTGMVTFVADSQANVNAVTPGATTDVTLASALSGLGIGDRLWLQGLGGADAALLNNASHEITNIATATYTLATNTTGATITASGTGRKYPQASEALAWTGRFYVPVRFDADELEWEIVTGGPEDQRYVQCPSILLVEVVIA